MTQILSHITQTPTRRTSELRQRCVHRQEFVLTCLDVKSMCGWLGLLLHLHVRLVVRVVCCVRGALCRWCLVFPVPIAH